MSNPYDPNTAFLQIVADMNVIYTETDPANCTTHTCYLKTSDCTTDYSGSLFTVGAAPAFALSMKVNDPAGWSLTVCVICTNDDDS